MIQNQLEKESSIRKRLQEVTRLTIMIRLGFICGFRNLYWHWFRCQLKLCFRLDSSDNLKMYDKQSHEKSHELSCFEWFSAVLWVCVRSFMAWFKVFRNSLSLCQLDVDLLCAVGLLEASLARRPSLIWIHLPEVVQVLLPLLQSPLSAPRVKDIFLQTGVCLMPKELNSLGMCSVYRLV